MVILGTQNKITDFFMILPWASPFKHDYSRDLVCEGVTLSWYIYVSNGIIYRKK